MNQVEKVEEIQQFYIVNSTQKKVRTDLAENLLKMIALKNPEEMDKLKKSGQYWKIAALNIIEKLNSDPESVWFNRVKKPNQPSNKELVVSQLSLMNSLKPVLRTFLNTYSESVIKQWVDDFWKALRKLMPEAFAEPRNYVIQKTPGVFSLHILLPDLILYLLGDGEITRESFIEILKTDPEHFCDPEFWLSGGEGAANYTSQSQFNLLANELRASLNLVKHE